MPPELPKRPMVLIIRDGWGHNPDPDLNESNAIYLANTANNDRLMAEYPNTVIASAGEAVGLPAGVMGNSEVGHQNIGAGRIVDQEIMRITKTVRDGSFFENEILLGAFEHARKTGGSVHL
ncbi:MAG: 2,3-bisphosphoglycerate-independent phosphoglycerate mutase, partial [Planctomycetota bacterium]